MRRRSWAELGGGLAVGFAMTVAVSSAMPARDAGVGPPAPAVSTTATATAVPRASSPVRRPTRLSHPAGVSRYAFVDRPVTVRASPSGAARALGRLRVHTADRTDEVVFALDALTAPDGRTWLRVRTALLPAGTVGWVRGDALSALHRVDTWLFIDRATQRLRLVRDGRTIFRAAVGVGTPGTPTPSGRFYVRDRIDGLAAGGMYGPVAFGTSARSTQVTDWPGGSVVGIHGTDEPDLLPGRVSHGCIRLRNADILRLAGLMPVGTPITIR